MEETRTQQQMREAREAATPQGERQAIEEATQIHNELADLNPNIEIDAKEFGEHVRNGGWRLGLLVARSVEAGAGHGGDRSIKSENSDLKKVSPASFARQADNITDKTVTKYLNAWNLAAADGLVPLSDELSPGQSFVFVLEDEEGNERHTPGKWDSYFKPPAGDAEKNLLKESESRLNSANSIDPAEYRDRSFFEGRSDYSLRQVYEANISWQRAVNQKADQISANLIALAKELEYEISYDDGE